MMTRLSLNLVYTYPVNWTCYQVLRDFVQNFYDSVGYTKWNNSFHYCYEAERNQLSMWVDDVTFSYEWLLHIGASTKQSSTGQYAGFYGEGFKIASLCALRDCGWQVCMSSGTWQLKPVCVKQKIDHTPVQMLAYDVETEKADIHGSRLELGHISQSDFRTFQTVLTSFYYPENPMMGKCLYAGSNCAVYERSREPIDVNLPTTYEFGRKGAVFCSFQMLGTNPFDLVVCLHDWKKKDRERNNLYDFDVVEVFEKATRSVNGEAAVFILEKMRRYWNSIQHKKIDIHSWTSTIDGLIWRIAASDIARKTFCERYPNLLYQPPVHTVYERNRRTQARDWLSLQPQHYTLVRYSFSRLGYASLEEVCESNGGFVASDMVSDPREAKCFLILENLVKQLYTGFFPSAPWPEHRIIVNERAGAHGQASLEKLRTREKNAAGFVYRYRIQYVYLKKTIFRPDGFYDALSTYTHEMCHMFGGDSSKSFSGALTLAMEILLLHNPEVQAGQQAWQEVFET